jgi:IS605 OrfB family transposase
MYAARAERDAVRALLRKLDTPLPVPILFIRHEFARGFMIGAKGNRLYLFVRLFGKKHHYHAEVTVDEGFIDWKTKESVSGKKFPGLILPLEFGREYHEQEYLRFGIPQTAKLLVKRNDAGEEELYVHIAFEFTPEPLSTETYLGIDRGSARIGAGTVVSASGDTIANGLNLEGESFNAEQRRHAERIRAQQKRGAYKPRAFRLRRRWADEVIGEYANRIIAVAVEHKSQIVLESINARAMAAFLSRSQFAKLHASLIYKAERAGLPKPIEVPAAYTSQTCAVCGHRDRASRQKKDDQGRAIQDVFLCTGWGHHDNADDNASAVIALRGLHQALKGGRFQKFPEFQQWLIELRAATAPKGPVVSPARAWADGE